MDAEKYSKRGVSASKSEIHQAIAKMDKGLFPDAFCKILPDVTGGSDEYVNIMHADTAGTKTSLAYIYWKETGDLNVWKGIVQDALVMNLDDMACVGCTDQIIISSTIGRNKHLIPKEVLEVILDASGDFIQKMKLYGINIHHSGGETADVGDIVRTIDVGFTAFARMRKDDLIINNIKPGNVIVGFASFGQSVYEDEYNGGMGSNGLTSARHDVFAKYYLEKYPESFDPNTDKGYIYSGTKKLTDKISIGEMEIEAGKLVLSPTRTYLPLLKKIFQKHRKGLHGIIHNTGGAQTKVLKFANECTIIKDNLFPVPPLFKLIQSESGTAWEEMYKVFNMGHRLEIYTEQHIAEDLMQIASDMQIDSRLIGRVEQSDHKRLILSSEFGRFEF